MRMFSHFSVSLSRNRKRVVAPPPPGGTLELKGDGATEEEGEKGKTKRGEGGGKSRGKVVRIVYYYGGCAPARIFLLCRAGLG